MAYGPIQLAYTAPGAAQTLYEAAEGATQTFKQGTIVKLSSGMAVAGDTNDPWGSADVVLGVSAEDAHNLTTANTAQELSIGTPIGQSSASIVPLGAPIKNGKVLLYKADGLNVFRISLKSGQTFAQSLVVAGSYYTLKYDSTTTFWYLDSTDTTGNNAVAEIVGGDSLDTSKVLFRFKAAQRYFD